jgi:hypothetical protein
MTSAKSGGRARRLSPQLDQDAPIQQGTTTTIMAFTGHGSLAHERPGRSGTVPDACAPSDRRRDGR